MKSQLSLLAVLAFWLIAAACGEKIEPGTREVPRPLLKDVRLAVAKFSRQPLFYEAVGTVQAGITSNLAAKLMSTIDTIAVREGYRVKKGDILVRLDQRQPRAAVRQAQGALSEAQQALAAAVSARDAARAAADLARATYQRYQVLEQESSVSAQEFDEVEARQRQAVAAQGQAEAMVLAATSRVKQATAALTAARITMKDTQISAPHAGIITAKLVDEGDLATPGLVLLTLESTEGYRLDLVVPETHIERVRLQQKVLVAIPALNLSDVKGTVSIIAPAADPDSRSFLVKVALPPAEPVRSGMFARIRIPLGQSNQILVPQSAVVRHGQLTGLYFIDSEGIAHFRLVRLGRIFQDSVEVLAGVNEGDRYVVKPPSTLIDGARVEAAS